MPANGATLRALHFLGSAAPIVEWLLQSTQIQLNAQVNQAD
jgi:hypothetical protein